ncbi:hypothetical protein ZEAMMB73_Zm00001d030179 [Zea mays]|uniref:Uncharacterized protein n=2 Tax=Zea mays TaxID=4577 RepID=A0A1D6KAU6_MAIZE|nr:hypothetical protein ZEAMMB73_Zm00001d030179 [Zea mays]
MSSLASVLDSQVKTSDSDPVPITCASSQICLSAAGGDYYSPASHLLELEGVCFLLDCPSTSPPSWPSRRCPSPVMQGVSSMWCHTTGCQRPGRKVVWMSCSCLPLQGCSDSPSSLGSLDSPTRRYQMQSLHFHRGHLFLPRGSHFTAKSTSSWWCWYGIRSNGGTYK